MRRSLHYAFAALIALHTTAGADTITFSTDPFAGSDALTTPGRQIVAGELFTDFDIAMDVFAFNLAVFDIDNIFFYNGSAAALPASGVNVIVLQEFGPPMSAGIAADLIADEITSPGAGFFIYFNTGLDLPRLVYSTDLSDNTSDLKILARLTNLTGQAGRDALPTIAEANFAIRQVPEPSSIALLGLSLAGLAATRRRKQ